MKFKVTNPTHRWHFEFEGRVFEVCEGYTEDHHQVPAMTQYGRTWFDRDAITILED